MNDKGHGGPAGDPVSRMSWDDFRLVKAIAEAGGLAGAAVQLGLNHSTVFRRLGQMETTLGVKLFERHRSGYAPTPPAEEMVSLAERMEEDVAALSRKVMGCALSPSGELRVTTNDTLLLFLVTPILAAFREAYPDIRLEVVVSNQALNLSKRDADVALRATDNPPEMLVGRRVAKLSWAVYGRRVDFPEGPVPVAELRERTWISLGDDLAAIKAARYVRDLVQPERIVYKLNTVLGLTEAVEAGIGIGPLPCFIADTKPGLARLMEPDPAFSAELWLLTHPDLRHAARVRVFLDFVAAEIMRRRPLLDCETALAAQPEPQT